jgi:hypothetical protein
MTYLTHAYLGAEIFPVICETWGVHLSRKRLIAGSIKPDRNSLFFRHPHFWKHSHRFIEKKIKKLAGTELVDGTKNKKFSEDLGIVLHYVADFFTSAHNMKPNKIREHIAFEDRLHRDFLALVDTESLRNTMKMIDFPVTSNLRHRHARFKSDMTETSNDIREITVACLTIASYIMNGATANLKLERESI